MTVTPSASHASHSRTAARRAAAGGSVNARIYLVSILGGVLGWELAARQVSPVVFAPPSAIVRHWIEDGGVLATALGNSLLHLLAGYLLAVAVAVPLGFLMGRNATVHHLLDPLVNALYAIPSVAFVPFLIIWFGLFFEARVALVFLMCVFDMLVVVTAAVRDVNQNLIEAARSFGAGPFAVFRKVLFPASQPFLFVALRIGLIRAIQGMITAELFFAAANLGAYVHDSATRFAASGILAVIVLLCLLGLAAQEGLKALEARLLPWHIRH